MTKVIGMLVALAMFCAMPAIAFGQGDNIGVGQSGNAINDAESGGDGGSSSGSGSGGDGGSGGDINQQAANCTQASGGDSNCEIDQSINGGDTHVDAGGGAEGDVDEVSGDDDEVSGGGDNVTSDVGGGAVEGVTLARTGFDAWILALLGGLALVGGLGLLVAQRRGRIGA